VQAYGNHLHLTNLVGSLFVKDGRISPSDECARIPSILGVTAITVYSIHWAQATRQLPECHPLPTQAVQSPYRQEEPLPPRNNSLAFQDVLRLTCVLAFYSSMWMPNVQHMPALPSHSWCHLKKDGRFRLLYHHTTTPTRITMHSKHLWL
jgi:hypothetical protein